jgi:Cu2+-exporting ATPase
MFLERLANISRVVFDKTGTLTRGRPQLGSVVTLSTMTRERALDIATALEAHSKHPIALAFEGATSACAQGVRVSPGEGVCGQVDGVTYRLGRPAYAAGGELSPPAREGSWVLLASEEPLAWFRLEDALREDAARVVAALTRDYEISMFTGDVSSEGRRLGELLGIEDVVANLTPEDKLARIRTLQDDGERVLMIGDGVNDAAAMAAASASIAVSPADIVVQEAADATLLAADLERVPLALEFAGKVRRVIRQNIAWAVCYNLFVIPLAVTGFIVPWMAALGMSASSILVVLNANRLYKAA